MGQDISKYDLNFDELESLFNQTGSEFEKILNYGENIPEDVFLSRKIGVKNIVKALINSDFLRLKESIKYLKLGEHTNKPRVSGAEDFISIPLFQTDELLLKIHIYPPKLTGVKQFHTHRYNVISAVIKGMIIEDIASKLEGDKYDVFEIEWVGSGQTQHVKTGELTDLSIERRVHFNGIYTIPNVFFHEVENSDLTITICMFIQKGAKKGTFLERKDTYDGNSGKNLVKIYEENNLETYKIEGLEYLIKNFS